jgi:hypothetical protein
VELAREGVAALADLGPEAGQLREFAAGLAARAR